MGSQDVESPWYGAFLTQFLVNYGSFINHVVCWIDEFFSGNFIGHVILCIHESFNRYVQFCPYYQHLRPEHRSKLQSKHQCQHLL